ncbi:predicted protein [Nematostella vectensis]|uniref:chitinase n=1 Tax=Nematostella vectensis TaxID=45351 RepID=A7S5Y6_NEMVE|nr:predicted protein [Nematostella vectensis]|eukprot:XP_001632951.1 predicted protein [Nematostella vectensis]
MSEYGYVNTAVMTVETPQKSAGLFSASIALGNIGAMMTVVQLALVLVIASLLSCASASTKRSLPSNRQLLVGYWGQNAAGPTFGRLNYERDLRHFCNNYDFDIYVIAFVHRLFDVRNKGPDPKLPGMNFAHHCSYVPDANYPGIYECATIGGGIRDCQKMGKKVIISLGGDTCDGTLGSAANARALAYNIWNMFLGGQDLPGKRPFLSAVLDGVDLDIEVGSYKYYPDFVREIRQLMRTDSSRQYLITAAPQCPFPDKWMGPQTPGSALEGLYGGRKEGKRKSGKRKHGERKDGERKRGRRIGNGSRRKSEG